MRAKTRDARSPFFWLTTAISRLNFVADAVFFVLSILRQQNEGLLKRTDDGEQHEDRAQLRLLHTRLDTIDAKLRCNCCATCNTHNRDINT